jgi:hypothetical protein
MILRTLLFILGLLAKVSGVAKYAKSRFDKNRKLIVFVALLPLRDLTLKIAFRSEKETGWRTLKITIPAVLTSRGTGLGVLEDILTGYYGEYEEAITVLNVSGFRTPWKKFKDELVGVKYPKLTYEMAQLLDALEVGPYGSTKDKVTDNSAENDKLAEQINALKNLLNNKEATNG